MAQYLDHTRIAQKLLDQQGEINQLTAALARVRALIAEYPVAVGTHLLEEALDQPKEQR